MLMRKERLLAGFAQVDIIPEEPVSLAGYFNKRLSNNVLDKLYAKIAILKGETGDVVIISLDLIAIPVQDVEKIKNLLYNKYNVGRDRIFISATHTHTAPSTLSLSGAKRESRYMVKIVYPSILKAFELAREKMTECEVYQGHTREKGLSFNRRYWMKGGYVLTNPPKGDPGIIKPEGPVDHSVTFLEFISVGKKRIGAIVNATNHADTIGEDKISADWPGHMAREINRRMGKRSVVMLLNGAAGNINHFDPKIKIRQASYNESRHIGKSYARYVIKALKDKKLLKSNSLNIITRRFTFPYRKVSEEEFLKSAAVDKAETNNST